MGDADFRTLCRHHGEKLALYFAFTQFYMLFLIPLALIGIFAHFCLPEYHPFYAVMLSIWTILFKHAWERRQRDLAIQWGVKGVTKLPEQRRAAYISEGERIDPISGETVGWFPRYWSPVFPWVNCQMEKYFAETSVYSGWTCIRLAVNNSVDNHLCL